MQRLTPSFSALWEGIGAQLFHPTGLRGRVAGWLMAFANVKPNDLAVAALEMSDGESLIELGCGPGRALHAILGLSCHLHVIGIDWSEVMLTQASRRNRPALEAGRLVLVRGNFTSLPIMDETTSAVLAVNVVYFMFSPAAVNEAHRVLRPGGHLVIYATDRSAMRHWLFAGPHTHQLFDCHRLTSLLVDGGFTAEGIRVESVNAGFGIKGLLAVAKKVRG